MFRTRENIYFIIGISFIIGGGIGNIFDRIVHGSVTDFLHIDMGIFKTGIFNLADVSIMFGTACILVYNLTKRKKVTAG
jgi:signal peptidase II